MFDRRPRPAGSWAVLCLGIAGCSGAQARRVDALAAYAHDLKTSSTALSDGPMSRGDLIRAVLDRNPGVDAARQALRATLSEHPKVTALDPPTLEYAFAPLSIGSDDVRFGQVIRIGQRFPWPGTLSAAGEVALAEADATKAGIRRVQLELATTAASLFDGHRAVERAVELTLEHEALAEEIKRAAEAQYAAGRAPQQDVLQAEVELAHVVHMRVVLESRRAVIRAKINGLLHRPPQSALELSAKDGPNLAEPDPTEALQATAVRRRPELVAARSRLGGRAAAIDLEKRRWFPSFGVSASYNSMWAQPEHQWMAGVMLSLPFVQPGARRAGVEQAEARHARTEAELSALEDEVRVQVEAARQRLVESQHVVHLFRERLLPAARAQIDAARIGYETGSNGFQALVAAERSLRDLEIQLEEARAAANQRRAELSFATGVMPVLEEERSAP